MFPYLDINDAEKCLRGPQFITQFKGSSTERRAARYKSSHVSVFTFQIFQLFGFGPSGLLCLRVVIIRLPCV